MTRRYESRLRSKQLLETRRSILDAAVMLHGKGVTDMGAIAQAAGVSLSTVRKYFPTIEDLFVNCSRHFWELHDRPRLEEAAGIGDALTRARSVVEQVYALHETAFGQAWLAQKLADESPAMARAKAGTLAVLDRAAAIILGRGPEEGGHSADARYGAVRGLLSSLTYRALRLEGGLSPDEAVRFGTSAIADVLLGNSSATTRKGDKDGRD